MIKIVWKCSDNSEHETKEDAERWQHRLNCQKKLKDLYTNFCLHSDAMLDNAEGIIVILKEYLDAKGN